MKISDFFQSGTVLSHPLSFELGLEEQLCQDGTISH